MRDNDRAFLLEHRVSAGVVEVVVRVDDEADGQRRDFADLGEQVARRGFAHQRIHHEHGIFANDKAGIRAVAAALGVDGSINAFREPLDLERRRRCLRLRRLGGRLRRLRGGEAYKKDERAE